MVVRGQRNSSAALSGLGTNCTAGWVRLGTGVENLAFTRIWSRECPSCSESLYRLSYPGPLNMLVRDVTTRVQRVNVASVLSWSVILKRIYMQSFAAVNRLNVKTWDMNFICTFSRDWISSTDIMIELSRAHVVFLLPARSNCLLSWRLMIRGKCD